MKHSLAYGSATFALVTFLSVPANLAHGADCQDLAWSNDRLSTFDATIASSRRDTPKDPTTQGIGQDQRFDLDAAIASLEQDVGSRKGDAAAKGQALLKELWASRDAYRTKLGSQPHVVRVSQGSDGRETADEIANAFWKKVNAYLDAVGADIATRQAVMQTRFLGN